MKRINLAIAVMALCAPLSAQNINQSVQVTNEYESRFSDFQKTGPSLQVPDSLYRFDYSFDYSVFETPYKGSYEFSPYRISVTPEARLYDGSKFFLRLGAGYTIHPQFEMAWQMLQTPDFAIGVFAEAGGYAGRYSRRGVAESFSGHDLNGRIGLGGQYLRPAVRLSYHFGYEGIFAGEGGAEPYFRSGFSSVIAAGRIQSRERPGNQMFYDIDLQYRYSSDGGRSEGQVSASGENNLRVAVSAGPVLASKYRILIDGLFELESLRGDDYYKVADSHGELFGGMRMASLGSIKPHVDFLLGPVRLDAGVRVDYSKGTEQGAFSVSPDVTARMALLDADMELVAGVSGGQYIQSHYAVKQLNHFAFMMGSSAKISREKLHVRAGLQGHAASRLQYELEAGYVSYQGMPLASLYGVLPVDYNAAYVQGRFSWRGPRLELDADAKYSYLRLNTLCAAFAPPAFVGELRGRYNWENRTWAGLFVEAQSSRLSLASDGVWIPWFANLGLTFEYRIDARWTFWAEAGNLLGMAIERAPGFIEKGQYGTVGFSLKL
ncbi:MAG: hypothetical protein SPK76_00695 [Bacteroidales bacterium]|nr:hypothetical protein [Bacteroidales bacterium]MDY6443529.1 hypothetical protein [Bacteroidales bacterium]